MITFFILFIIVYILLCYTFEEKNSAIFLYGICIFLGTLSLFNVGFNIFISLSGTAFILVHWLLSLRIKRFNFDIKPELILLFKGLPALIFLFYLFDGFSGFMKLKWIVTHLFLAVLFSLLVIYILESAFKLKEKMRKVG